MSKKLLIRSTLALTHDLKHNLLIIDVHLQCSAYCKNISTEVTRVLYKIKLLSWVLINVFDLIIFFLHERILSPVSTSVVCVKNASNSGTSCTYLGSLFVP